MLEARDIVLRTPEGSVEAMGGLAPVLDGLSLTVTEGELICVVGSNGAGKSSLAAALSGSVMPQSGNVLLDGDASDALGLHRAVGRVRQDPESQLVAPVVFDEVAFGPFNLGLAEGEVRALVSSALDSCGLGDFGPRAVSGLSGGEKQRLAFAGVLAMRPRFLVLDEVTAQLDPHARHEVLRVILDAAKRGIGVVLITHDLDEVAHAERAVLVEGGKVAWEGAPDSLLGDASLRMRARLLGPNDVRLELADDLRARPFEASDDQRAFMGGLTLDSVSVFYDDYPALVDASVAVRPGRVTLLAGRSGSGKTTAIRAAAGLLRPDTGSVLLDGVPVAPGAVGYVQQRSEDQLFCDTVLDDVMYGPRNLGVAEGEARRRAEAALASLDVEEGLWGRSPFALSGGQRKRVATAGVLAMDTAALVLDEPTNGLDGEGRLRMYRLALEVAAQGRAVLVSSHDVDEWLVVTNDVVLLDAGKVAWSGPAEEFDRSLLERG